MNKRTLLLCGLLLLLTKAQAQTGHELTVFTETGEKFWLIVNGVQVNDFPATRVTLADTPHDQVEVLIRFANDALENFIQNPVVIRQGKDVVSRQVQYELLGKAGKFKLKMRSNEPRVTQAAPGVYMQQGTQPGDGRVKISAPAASPKPRGDE